MNLKLIKHYLHMNWLQIFLYLGISGGSFAILGGVGLYGIAGLASYLGFGSFASVSVFGIGTGGVGFALVGIGVGFSLLLNHFDKKR